MAEMNPISPQSFFMFSDQIVAASAEGDFLKTFFFMEMDDDLRADMLDDEKDYFLTPSWFSIHSAFKNQYLQGALQSPASSMPIAEIDPNDAQTNVA